MGKYAIVIHGEGQHHSDEDQQADANKVALDMVAWLKKEGHAIASAIFNHGPDESGTLTKTDDLHAMTEPVPQAVQEPATIKVFKIESEGDTVYVQASDEDLAKKALFDAIGEIPESMLTVTEVPAIPEGETLLNPLDH